MLALLSELTAAAPSLSVQLAAVVGWLAVVGLAAEGLRRFAHAGPEATRKVVHIGVGNVILLAWWLQIPAWVAISASVIFSGVALLSYRFPILPAVNSVGRNSLGTFFYAVSIGVVVAWFWPLRVPQYAVIGILVMTWGDGLAALVGQNFGRHPYQLWGMQKSWEGSLAMAIASFIVSAGILTTVQGPIGPTWGTAIAIALVATGLEAFSKFGVDNLTVPLGSAIVGFLLNGWIWQSFFQG